MDDPRPPSADRQSPASVRSLENDPPACCNCQHQDRDCCVRNPRFEQKRFFVGGDDVPPLGDLDFFTLAQEVFNLLEAVP
jgi:hypothetical protein